MNKKIFLFSLSLILMLSLSAQQKVLIQTSKGDIVLKLYEETPVHRDNFIKLVKEGFYDSTLFHRVIANFMVQGGDPQSKNASANRLLGNGGPGYTLEAEIKKEFIHKKGALAAARQPDNTNPKRRSSGSQFYLVQGRTYPKQYLSRFEEERETPYTEEQKEIYANIGGTPHLDGQYTVFGEVVSGLTVVDDIAAVTTNNADRPTKDVVITKMKLID
ncbi:MAG: peptidylprolyl isomerase [Vicingaceae bacterium]